MSNRKKNINRDKIYDYTTESTLDMNLLLEVWKVFLENYSNKYLVLSKGNIRILENNYIKLCILNFILKENNKSE